MPWLQPKVLLPITGLLAAAAIAFGLLFLLMGDKPQDLVVNTCKVGEPGCVLRQEVHEHANFALFIRGQQFDFNKPEFLSTETNERGAYVHLHAPRPGVVHVHFSNTTWDEFLRALGFELVDSTFLGTPDASVCLTLPDGTKLCNTATEKFRFIVNGVKVDGVSNSRITDLDRVVISYGPETDEQVRALYDRVGDDACIVSGRCLERGKAENEPCTGVGTCGK